MAWFVRERPYTSEIAPSHGENRGSIPLGGAIGIKAIIQAGPPVMSRTCRGAVSLSCAVKNWRSEIA